MSYTREAISDTPTPTAMPAIMKDDVVIDPYSRSRPKTPIGQADKSGTTAVETKPAAETVTLSPQVAALARKEQKFRQQEQALKDREAALEAKSAKIAKLEAMEAKLAAKDYSGLDEVGVDYNEYSQYQINKLNGSDPTQEAIKKLEAKLESVEKANQDNVSKQFEAAVNERRLAVKQLVETSSDKYPGITKLKQQEAVVQHILDTWEHDSKELSIEDATREVEEILVEKAKQWASVLDIKAPEAADQKKQLPPLKSGLKTITNQVTSGELKKPAKSFQGMSDSERYAEARRRAEEKLQQQKA